MCDRNEVLQRWAQASHTAPLILCNNWLKKTKYCGNGHLGGACRSKVCLLHPWPWFLYKLALSLSMRERERRRGTWAREKERKQCCFGSCLHPHPLTQAMFVPNNIGFDLGWSCFFIIFLFPLPLFLLFLFFRFLLLAETPLKYWLKTKACGRHLDPCS